MRPGARSELLRVDYVLPFLQRFTRKDVLRLPTRSPLARGTLYFGRNSFPVDRIAYLGIFLEGWYRTEYRDAVVVDIGGHKGYFGAFALLEGAREVHSFEPEPTNFGLLERASGTFGPRWLVRRAAVGAESGTATLHVSAESAGHSVVHEESQGRRRTLGNEEVEVVGMREVLERASERGGRLIVKVDAEGSECDIVLGTDAPAWRDVDEIFLEVHDFAACSADQIIDHLASAGLRVAVHEHDEEADLVVLRRADALAVR